MEILTIAEKKNERFLRKKTIHIPISELRAPDMRKLLRDMRKSMKQADGVGLSANQVGIQKRFFVAEMPATGEARAKFYVIFNPEIIKMSKEETSMEEGCLSIPGLYGTVPRASKVTIEGMDIQGKRIKIKAWGFLARIFQHEMDHLNGALFIDHATETHSIFPREK